MASINWCEIESIERQKFVSNARYVREMPYKMDSESQAYLRQGKQNREQAKKKQKHHKREKQSGEAQSSIFSTGSYDTLWPSNLPVIRQTFANESSEFKHGSVIKSSGNSPGLKLPLIDNRSVKQKLKCNISVKKVERSVLDPIKVTSDLGAQQDCTRKSSETAFENRKRFQMRNMTKSSNLSLDHRGLETKNKVGTIPAQAQSSLTQFPTLTSQGTAGSPTPNKLSGSSLLHHRRAPFRSRGKSFCSIQYLTREDSFKETEDADQLKRSLSLSISQFPKILEHRNKFREIYLAQGERHTLEEGGNDKNASSSGGKPSHRPLRGHRMMVTAVELQRRESQDSDKLYPPDRNCLEDADHSEFEDRPSNSSIRKMLNNVNYRDRAHVYCKEWQSHESSERCHGCLSSVRHSQTTTTPNSPGSSAPSAQRPSANWSAATYSPQTQDLDDASTLKMHTPLAFVCYRDNSSTSESFDSSQRLHNTPEDSSLRENSINDSWNRNISSPGGTSYVGETLRGSPRPSYLESSSPSVFQTRVTPDLHIACVLHDQLPLTFLALPYLHTQSHTISNTTISHSATTEEVKRPWADQEELKQHESLLPEDSEEEGDECCICQIAGSSPTNPLLEPCGCVGSLQFVQQECQKKQLKTKIKSGADPEAVKTCELRKHNLITPVDNFNVNAHYRNHQESRLFNQRSVSKQIFLFKNQPGSFCCAASLQVSPAITPDPHLLDILKQDLFTEELMMRYEILMLLKKGFAEFQHASYKKNTTYKQDLKDL